MRPFQEPLAVYAAGHRGVDFAAPRGSAVRAANAGVVSFAGTVAGSLHVVVAHDGGHPHVVLVPPAHRRPRRAIASQRGQIVGAAGGSGDGHGAGVLHFGVRVGERYVDPMLLFEPDDLTQLVRLVPVDERDAAGSGRCGEETVAELAKWLREGARRPGDYARAVISSATSRERSASATRPTRRATRSGRPSARDWISSVERGGAAAARGGSGRRDRSRRCVEPDADRRARRLGEAAVGRRWSWRRRRSRSSSRRLVVSASTSSKRLTSCPQPDPVAHPTGSGNFVMAVAGQGSSRKRHADGSVTARACTSRPTSSDTTAATSRTSRTTANVRDLRPSRDLRRPPRAGAAARRSSSRPRRSRSPAGTSTSSVTPRAVLSSTCSSWRSTEATSPSTRRSTTSSRSPRRTRGRRLARSRSHGDEDRRRSRGRAHVSAKRARSSSIRRPCAQVAERIDDCRSALVAGRAPGAHPVPVDHGLAGPCRCRPTSVTSRTSRRSSCRSALRCFPTITAASCATRTR